MLPAMTNKEIVEVVQGEIDGERIQYAHRFGSPEFSDCRFKHGATTTVDHNEWDFENYTYRIKPKKIKFWITYYPTNKGDIQSRIGSIYEGEREALSMLSSEPGARVVRMVEADEQ